MNRVLVIDQNRVTREQLGLACLGQEDPAAVLAGLPGLFLAVRCRARVAYSSDPAEAFGDFTDLEPWSAAPEAAPVAALQRAAGVDEARDEIRRIVLEELRELVKR